MLPSSNRQSSIANIANIANRKSAEGGLYQRSSKAIKAKAEL
jgi:hypothetical protein